MEIHKDIIETVTIWYNIAEKANALDLERFLLSLGYKLISKEHSQRSDSGFITLSKENNEII